MIYTENLTINGKLFVKTYSDTYMVERDGVQYSEAIDLVDSGRIYTESNTPLLEEETETNELEEKAKAYDILMGVANE